MKDSFYMLLYRVFHAKRSYLHARRDGTGLGTGQPKLLVYLKDHEACNQKELAEYFEIDPSAVSRMLRAMEKNGFVTRRTDPESRRSDRVTLTEKGGDYAEIWRANYRKLEKTILKGFSPEEAEQFAGYLLRAYKNFQSEGGGGHA